MKLKISAGVAVILLTLLYLVWRVPTLSSMEIPVTSSAIEQGEYLLAAGGCVSCHESTKGDGSLSGGMALESDFGTFYVPNITPDLATGIGSWSGEDFLLALKHGRSPSSSYYFPAFPYGSYSGMSDEDVLDIAAYLMSLEPVNAKAPAHETPFWLVRPLMLGWNLLASLQTEPSSVSVDGLSDERRDLLLRGEYLARHLGHCGECHTPRNALGMLDGDAEFDGADFATGHVEAINGAALEQWSEEDFAFFLLLGLKPDGDYVGGEMEPVIEHNTSQLSDLDRRALAAFFKRDQPRLSN